MQSAYLSYRYLPLQELLEQLKENGFQIGVNTLLDIHQVLSTFNEQTDKETIKLTLCPLLAENPEQQIQFYQIFDKLFENYQRKEAKIDPYSPAAIQAQLDLLKREERKHQMKIDEQNRIRLAFLVVILCTGFGFWLAQDFFMPNTQFESLKVENTTTDSSFTIKADSATLAKKMEKLTEKQLKEAEEKRLREESRMKAAQREIEKIKEERLKKEKRGRIEEGEKTLKSPAYMRDFPNYQREVSVNDEFTIKHNTMLLKELSDTEFEFQSVKAPDVSDLEFVVDIPIWFRRINLVKWWIFSVVLLSYLVYEGFLFIRKRKALARQQSDNEANALAMNLDAHYHVSYPDDFAQMAESIRTEKAFSMPQLQIAQTVKATASNGGILDLVYADAEKPSKYLVLIDQSSRRNQQSLLFDFMSTVLVKHDVYVNRYYFNKDLRKLWSESSHEPVDFNYLFTHYADHKLVVFGSGDFAINFLGKTLNKWTEDLLNWEERTLFTPKEPVLWNWVEDKLQEIFRVLPATIEGMMELAQRNEVVDADVFQEIKGKKSVGTINLTDAPEVVVENLKYYLQPNYVMNEKPEADVMTWLAACCLYPQLFWDLTLFIGKELSSPSNNLLNTDNLTKLTNLRWFQEGRIPEGVRELLIFDEEILSAEQRKRVAAAIAEQIDSALKLQENEEEISRDKMYLLTLQLLDTAGSGERKKLMRELRSQMRGSQYDDALACRLLKESAGNQWEKVLPEQTKKWLFNGDYAFTGFNWRARVAFTITLLCLPFLMREAKMDCESPVSYRGKNYCLGTQADSARFMMSIALADYDQDFGKGINADLMQKAMEMKHEYKENKVSVDYNMAISFFNQKKYQDAASIAGHLLNTDNVKANIIGDIYELLAISYLNLGLNEAAILNIQRAASYLPTERANLFRSFLAQSAQKKMMTLVEGGTFKMGSEDGIYSEKPVHNVRLSDFHLGTTEVTNSEYARFLNQQAKDLAQVKLWIDINGASEDTCRLKFVAGVYTTQVGYENHPVVFVSWYGATAYAHWLGGRLPSEAEWEYAAKGGRHSVGYQFSGSDLVQHVGWHKLNAKKEGIQPVGNKYPNELGIYDMSGNAWEWCNDWYQSDYYKYDDATASGPNWGDNKIVRGGAWLYSEKYLQTYKRYSNSPDSQFPVYGFRVAFD